MNDDHLVEMVVNRIKIDENRNEQVIILKEKAGSRLLPVVIGMAEVNAIKLKLSGVEPPRPLTHDLLLKVLEGLNAKVTRIVIDRLEQNTFFAKLVIRDSQGSDIEVDARPSDSIAVTLRASAPIFVHESVIESAGLAEA